MQYGKQGLFSMQCLQCWAVSRDERVCVAPCPILLPSGNTPGPTLASHATLNSCQYWKFRHTCCSIICELRGSYYWISSSKRKDVLEKINGYKCWYIYCNTMTGNSGINTSKRLYQHISVETIFLNFKFTDIRIKSKTNAKTSGISILSRACKSFTALRPYI